MKQSFFLLFAFFIVQAATAQNVGIGTTTPGSRLQVAGSFAPNYTVVTTSPYTLGADDYYVLFNGGFGAGVFTLPAGTAVMKGRNYFIKNGSIFPMQLKASGTETIDGDSAVLLNPGEVVHIVMKGAAGSGVATSEVVSVTQGSYSFFNAGFPGRPWNTNGNSGTDPAKNYIGTGDNQDFVIRTYATERIRVTKDGKTGIGTTTPVAPLHVVSTGSPTAGFFTSAVSGNLDSGVLRAEYTGTSPDGKTAIAGNSASGIGVLGFGSMYGVKGYAYAPNGTIGYSGVEGVGIGQTGTVYGVRGLALQYQSIPNGGTKIGVFGYADGGTTNFAGMFNGNVQVNNGNLTVGGTKSFLIDHPTDPENKYLYHYCIESNEVLNVYSGNVTTDASGVAVVQLPAYFQSINKDFRYQLTTIGSFAQAMVQSEITEGNSFTIATSLPGVKVSWQVTAVRNDKYMQAHPAKAEVEKEAASKGKYLQPAEWQQPETKSIFENPVDKKIVRTKRF